MYSDQSIKEIQKLIDDLSYRQSKHSVLTDVFEVSAIALSNKFDFQHYEKREQRYLDIVKKYNDRELDLICQIFAEMYVLLSQPVKTGAYDDYLGKIYMQSDTSNSRTGQFFTPFCLSQMCAKIALNDPNSRRDKRGIITLNEPTCGSGGMILASIQTLQEQGINYARDLYVECADLDSRCVHMTYLQLSLAAVPAVIFHRNTLSLQTYSVWYTPALIFQRTRFNPYITDSLKLAYDANKDKEILL